MATRVLIGKASTARGGSGNYGMWVSRTGKDVLTCTDDELLFSTDLGGSSDIKGLFQLQAVTGTATETSTTTIAANTTTTISFNNFNWNFGAILLPGTTIGSTFVGSGQPTLSVSNVTTSSATLTNTGSLSGTFSFSVIPQFTSVARF